MDPILRPEPGALQQQHSARIPPCNGGGGGGVGCVCRPRGQACSRGFPGAGRTRREDRGPRLRPSPRPSPTPPPRAPQPRQSRLRALPRPGPGPSSCTALTSHAAAAPRGAGAGPGGGSRRDVRGGTPGPGGAEARPGGWVPQRRFQLFRCLKLAPAERCGHVTERRQSAPACLRVPAPNARRPEERRPRPGGRCWGF
ncbi:RAD9, HUS1, RAD1-interacting nuclear orphan protein 1 isoform X3 [Cricetulus griseus]|uniref:RAD9, HUS1, RAD1-interacting nuclear orphan protein 1 isoform X3 n=1 Tax=Cricetulus griseus TaxID=10029 RepID=A0A9J7H615_CRIGR|nr:RAD9, HUS1, RAD1-interacting nuclear orphan protein 1 isoform X3 [Cricetulus griseus]